PDLLSWKGQERQFKSFLPDLHSLDLLKISEREQQRIGRDLHDGVWETEGAYKIGVNLLQEVFRIERLLGVDELGHVMDSPGQWPQWQFHEGQRAALLESQGFRVDREIHRFEFHTGEAKLPSVDERGLIFRSLIGVGEKGTKAPLILG